MSLQAQIIPISFYKGIDNKNDDKNSVPGELSILENGVFKETGKISKRNGFTSITRESTYGNISNGSALANFNEELLQFTGSDVLAFSEAENIWMGRGRDYQLTDKTSPIYSNDKQQQNVEAKILDNIELYVWEEFPAGGIKYSIIDHVTGSILISNALVDEYGSRPKVIVFNNQFVIIYYNTGKLYAKTIDVNTVFTLNDSILLVSDINTDSPQFDVLVSRIPDGLFYLAYSRFNLNSTSLIYFNGVTSIGAVTYALSRSSAQAINIWEDNLSNIWVLGCDKPNNTNYTLSVCGIRQRVSGTLVSNGYTVKTTNVNQPIFKIFGFRGELTGENTILYEVSPLNEHPGFSYSDNYGNYINKAIVTTDGQVFSNNLFKRGLSIYSKPFLYNNIYFFLAVTNSTFQSTYFLIDETGVIASRSNVNQGGGSKANALDGFPLNTCTDSVPDFTTDAIVEKFLIPLQIKNSFISDNNTIYLPTGINKVKYDFGNFNKGLSNITLGNNLNISGGIFKNYDGFNFVENNFFQYPENVSSNNIPFSIFQTQIPTLTLPQIVQIILQDASRILQSSYFTIDSLNQSFYVWFNKDNLGTDPVIGSKTGIEVNIRSNYSNDTVLDKIIAVLPSSLFSAVKNGSGLTVTNQIIGAGTINVPNIGNMNTGGMIDGTYLYSAIYEWIDGLGQIVRSTPSVSVSVSTSGNTTIIVPTLRLTDKKNVKIVIYRTENLGSTVFYRVTDLLNPLQNNTNVDFVTFIDNKSDAEITSNDTLYTLGGVLPNAAPPSSQFSALYKNRIFIGGLEDGNLLWFSKENTVGSTVEFSEFLTFKCDPHFGNITALGVLDDKLIIFKENGMFYLAGTGPTNTGSNNDYNTGFNNISTDVGCIESKSVVITKLGLMFKSKKGIYLLDRGLNTVYIGANVQDYNNLTITSAIVNPLNNQVRFSTENGTMLVYDYYTGQWSIFTNLPAVDAIFINSNYYLLKPNGVVYKEDPTIYTDDGEFIKLKIQTGWFSFAKLQGYQRVRRSLILGSYLGKHKLNVTFYYDFNRSPPQFSEINAGTLIGENELWGSEDFWGDSDVWGGNFVPYEFNIHMTRQKCTSFKIEISDFQEGDFTEGFDISNIAFEIGVKQGTNKLAPTNKFGNTT